MNLPQSRAGFGLLAVALPTKGGTWPRLRARKSAETGGIFWSLLLLLLALVGGLGLGASASGDDGAYSPRIAFDIPQQPLVTALQAYGTVSGVQVLYETSLAEGQTSQPVRGRLTREEALRMMLEGHDLVVQYSRADAITLVNPENADADEPPAGAIVGGADLALDTLYVDEGKPAADASALAGYIEAIQQDVQTALQKASRTRSGSYRAGIELWVDPSRTVRQTGIFQSSGDPSRDRAISAALEGLALRQSAPPNTRQPVRVMIVVRSL